MTRSRRPRHLALLAALSTVLLLAPCPGWSADAARFAGRVFDADGITPREGVVVALFDAGNRQVYRSEATGGEGSFAIDAAPAGSYDVVAETGDGAFLAAEAVRLQPGDNRPVALRLAPGQANQGSTLEPWKKWTVAGAIGVTALVLVLDVTDEVNEEIASPDENVPLRR